MKEIHVAPEKALAEWRKANRWATEAEDAVFLASMAYARGSNPLPAESTRRAAKQLRERATALFESATHTLQEPRELPDSNRQERREHASSSGRG